MANIDVTAIGRQADVLYAMCNASYPGSGITAAAHSLMLSLRTLTAVVAEVDPTRPFPTRFLFVPAIVKPVAPKV